MIQTRDLTFLLTLILLTLAWLGCGPRSTEQSGEAAADLAQSRNKTTSASQATAADLHRDAAGPAEDTTAKDDPPLAAEAQASGAPQRPKRDLTTDAEAEIGKPPQDETEPSTASQLPPPLERLLLLAPGGPLVVELALTIDGKPHTWALQRLVDQTLQLADTDGDGVATWDELTRSPRFRYGQFGNVSINTETERRQMVRLYDINRNQRVDPAELPRLLTRNAGGSKSFSLRSSNFYRERNRIESPVRRILDANRDGLVSTAEMAEATVRLRSWDADDDDVLYRMDFQSLGQQLPPPLSRRRTSDPESACLLGPTRKWSAIQYSLEEFYALGRDIHAEHFPRTPGLFARLDQNQNQVLDADEFQQLNQVEPHIRLQIDFGADDGDPTGTLRLLSLADSLGGTDDRVTPSRNRISIKLPGLELEFFVNDLASQEDFQGRAQMLLSNFDQDANRYIEADELPDDDLGFIGDFDEVDANADGKIYASEIVAYLKQQQSAIRSQIRCRAGHQSDALFTALDGDSDGRLSSREIAAVERRLQSLDTNQDGQLAIDEIPGSMLVGFLRGDPTRGDALFAMPTSLSISQSRQEAPAWFWNMDANQDGDVSLREFPGTADQFDQLDVNNDSYIDRGEARSPDSALAQPPADSQP